MSLPTSTTVNISTRTFLIILLIDGRTRIWNLYTDPDPRGPMTCESQGMIPLSLPTTTTNMSTRTFLIILLIDGRTRIWI
jgi:hypothetical protein